VRLLAFALALSAMVAAAFMMWPHPESVLPERSAAPTAPPKELVAGADDAKTQRRIMMLILASVLREEKAELLMRQ
jgi:hypothetical protein